MHNLRSLKHPSALINIQCVMVHVGSLLLCSVYIYSNTWAGCYRRNLNLCPPVRVRLQKHCWMTIRGRGCHVLPSVAPNWNLNQRACSFVEITDAVAPYLESVTLYVDIVCLFLGYCWWRLTKDNDLKKRILFLFDFKSYKTPIKCARLHVM